MILAYITDPSTQWLVAIVIVVVACFIYSLFPPGGGPRFEPVRL